MDEQHKLLYLEIANLSNKSDDQLTEMADKYRAETIEYEVFQTPEGKYKTRQVPGQVEQRISDDKIANRRGHIRGDQGEGSVIEWMNTYEVISNTLYAHLFRYQETMYLLFPYAGPYGPNGKSKVDLEQYVLAAKAMAPSAGGGAAEAQALSAGGGGAAALRTLELNPMVSVDVARATDYAMRTLCSQLLVQHPHMHHIVPCGFSLGAFLATQFTYYWSLSGQTVPCSAIAMAPVPIAPIYTGTPKDLEAAQYKVFAFALVVQLEGKSIIDQFMLSDYSGACTPPANLRTLTYTPPDTVRFGGDDFLDLKRSIEHYKRTASTLMETRSNLQTAQGEVNALLQQQCQPPELNGMSRQAVQALQESIIGMDEFMACLEDMSPDSDMKLLKHALAKNQLCKLGIRDEREVLTVVNELRSQAAFLGKQTLDILDGLKSDSTSLSNKKLQRYQMRSLAQWYTELTEYTLFLEYLENLPDGYVASRDKSKFHNLSTYIDMAKKALLPANLELSLKYYMNLRLKF